MRPIYAGTNRIGLVLGVAVIVTGCSSNRRILNPTVDRTPIVFESDQGANAFEEALDERYDDGEADIAQLRGRLSRNAFFNQEIRVADSNGDGVITDLEAWRYAKPE